MSARYRLVILTILTLAFVLTASGAKAAPDWTMAFTVIPSPKGDAIQIIGEFELASMPAFRPIFLNDYGQLIEAAADVDGRGVDPGLERKGDMVLFRKLPRKGFARVVYSLRCVQKPAPGYRKRIMGGPEFVFALRGPFLAVSGHEDQPVSIRWALPPNWSIALGREGTMSWRETQETAWAAGMFTRAMETGPEAGLHMAFLAALDPDRAALYGKILCGILEYGVQNYGPLSTGSLQVAVFPRGTLGGGTAVGFSLATDDDPITAVHEMLHNWSNHQMPAWFREGVHTYMAASIMQQLGLLGPGEFDDFLGQCLKQHQSAVRQEGMLTLEQSSSAYDAGRGGADIYGLAPLFAYRLDMEIRRLGVAGGLETIFSAVCRDRSRYFDPVRLIEERTGVDLRPLFDEYFYRPVPDATVLL